MHEGTGGAPITRTNFGPITRENSLEDPLCNAQAIWLGLRAFSQRVENTRVALMSDNTSAVAYLRNQGGTKSLAMNDLATDICLWSEKRGMTLVPRYLPGHLNVLADHLSRRGQILKTEWSLNQTVADRIFRAWGRPSDKPDKGLSKQGQNRKRRDRPDSARLAQPGVVSGPIRSLDRLSNNSPTSAETAQADLLTPLSSASVASQPSRLVVIKGFHKERGFSEAVAQMLAISQRQSSAGVYESKWKVFGEWCHVKQINPVKAIVQQLADFLIFLFEEKKLAISSIQGYRSCISKVFLARGIDISHDRDLNMLVRNFAIERPVQHREAPRWDLMVVLRLLMKPPFEPMNMADMTRKLAFLDEKLNWHQHIKFVKNKISSSLYAMRKVKNIISKIHLLTLYNSLVYPYIDYGITLWGTTHETYVKQIAIMQKKAIRITTGANYNDHTEPLFKQLKLLTLKDVHKIKVAKFMFSASKGILPSPLIGMYGYQ